MTPIDQKSFWQAIGNRAVGATIVAAAGSAGPAGLLGLSATHVCADPPTMLVAIGNSTSALATVREAGHFAISYLPAGTEAVVDLFSGKAGVKGADRFEAGKWTTLETGAPVFAGAVGAVDCTVEEIIKRHDTSLVLGRVVALAAEPEARPLVYFRGGYI